MKDPLFHFQYRWREELVVTTKDGAFVLEMPIGNDEAPGAAVYLPSEDLWQRRAPDWAVSLWPDLRGELESWCREHRAKLCIFDTSDPTAIYYRFRPP
jgi:hypothetical protein